MLGVGEKELTIENNNTIPWLILNQLIVILLLFALLFFFTLLPLGPDDHHHYNLVTADTPPPPTTSSSVFFFDDIQIQQIDSPFTNHDSSPTHPPTTLQVTHFFSPTNFFFFCYFNYHFYSKKEIHLFVFVC